jgi:hypothetical protein
MRPIVTALHDDPSSPITGDIGMEDPDIGYHRAPRRSGLYRQQTNIAQDEPHEKLPGDTGLEMRGSTGQRAIRRDTR